MSGSPPSVAHPSPRGWLAANRWLLARRLTQLGVLGLFLLPALPGRDVGGLWASLLGRWPDLEGMRILTGNLSASLLLDSVPFTDPHLLLQGLLAGQTPVASGLLGGLIVLVFYALVGGRVFCSWVCPLNPVTDGAAWLRRRLGLKSPPGFDRDTRYWLLGLTLVLALVSGQIAWELVNPVSLTHRGLIFGIGWTGGVVLAVFLYDLLVSRHGWCGSLCPVGAFYSLVGHRAMIRVVARDRNRCNDCLDCYQVCPEPQVIRPALKGPGDPLIRDPQCTNCGRCIDVCAPQVFRFGPRLTVAANPNPAQIPATARPPH